jgi:ubiquinone/menaquinone biosynthesis C-methylase UbiE
MATGNGFSGRVDRLNNAERLKELRPGELLAGVAGVREGMVCVDLGCGTGVFTVPMADLVGAAGRVYAVDTSREMLDYVAARRPGPQVTLVQADAGRTGLEGDSTDVCVAAFVLHEVASPSDLLAEAYRLLAPDGVVTVVEWKADVRRGPPPGVRIGSEKTRELLARAGFAGDAYVDWSENHYAVTSKKGR